MLGGGECVMLGGGGGSRRARHTGTTILEVKWNLRQFSFRGAYNYSRGAKGGPFLDQRALHKNGIS